MRTFEERILVNLDEGKEQENFSVMPGVGGGNVSPATNLAGPTPRTDSGGKAEVVKALAPQFTSKVEAHTRWRRDFRSFVGIWGFDRVLTREAPCQDRQPARNTRSSSSAGMFG